jgi:large subunit ribosomal protein L24
VKRAKVNETRTKLRLKKDDPVIVVRGNRKDRGKVGKIIRIIPDKHRVVIEKVHVVKEYVKPNPQKNIQGGIVDREGSIPFASIMFYCKECEQGVRVGYKAGEGAKSRVCKRCGIVID